MGYFDVQTDENKYIKASNIVTNNGRNAVTESFVNNAGPDWLYVAVGMGSTAPASADTALVHELLRKQATGVYSPNPGTVRFLGVFTADEGNGDWKEVGIFDSAATRKWLHQCEATSGWSSDGTLSQETSVVQQGAASIESLMLSSDQLAFQNGSLNYGTVSWGTTSTDYFQFWHRTEVDIGTATVKLGNGTANYYQWSWAPGTTDSWAHFHQTLSSGSVAGTPTSSLDYFSFSHSAMGTTFSEFIDGLTMYREGGTLMARGTVDATKTNNTVRNVYYSLKVYGA